MKKTLLLNASYEALSFINERRVFKFLFKDKVEIISTWDDIINWGSFKLKYPSILRLKHQAKRNYFNVNFTRKSLIKRDKGTCQYCNRTLIGSQITIDHVIPRSQGGPTSFLNCVICCHDCNSAKADKTPEQAGMKLLRKPVHPAFTVFYYANSINDYWHQDWDDFLSKY